MLSIITRLAAIAGVAVVLSGCVYERVPERRAVVVAPPAPPPAVVVRPAY